MNRIYVPEGYCPKLSNRDLQLAIDFIKRTFQKELSEALNLKRVSAPLFVDPSSGINDNLSGVERPVAFDIPAIGIDAEIVHSLAKWKRVALKRYGFAVYEGLVTDMKAIRRDEELDNLHSVYVDQWDWEKIISESDRHIEFLKTTVRGIAGAVCETNRRLKEAFPAISTEISDEVSFVTTQELEDLYPDCTPSEREIAYVKEHRTAFIMQIGGKLRSGIVHADRAPDYDDWTLNGDIFVWSDVLQSAIEISSMGIRVNRDAMDRQLSLAGCDDRRTQEFHRMLLGGELPQTVGGGIGQSRLCMLLLQCCHIGEVQSSLWDENTVRVCREKGVPLL